jgi:hypothetical protein
MSVDTARLELPDGTSIRERKKAPSVSKTAALRWAEARERVLLVHRDRQGCSQQRGPEKSRRASGSLERGVHHLINHANSSSMKTALSLPQ